MRYTDVILSAFSSLRQHKLRAALTMLGVVIGVASVIAMVSIGAGARERVATQIRSLGSNLLVVIPGNITQGGVRLGFGATPTLSSEDANAIASEISSVQIAAPLSTAKGQAVAGGINWATNISMIEPSYLEARDWEIAEGRSFEGEELQRGAQVALLGRTVLDKLFPDTDAVGTTMRIGKVPFKIIGILAAKGQSAFGQDQDDVIYIPLVTGQRLGGRNQVKAHSVSGIYVKVTDGESLIATQDDITDLLRQRHRLTVDHDDDFSVRNIADLTSAKEASANTLSWLLAAVAGVSLVVGGIGIANIMLVSVTERTKEIGIRLALGARGADIFKQFLCEAIAMTSTGGVIGIVFGMIAAYAISQIAGWPLLIDPYSVVIAVIVSGLIGAVFGLGPAMRASRLNPVDALRAIN